MAIAGEGCGGAESLSVVLPAWNEEAGIARTVAAVVACGDELVERGAIDWFEVVVVDDASSDATADLVDELARHDDRIRLVRHEQNAGLGGALITGFVQAKGSLVLYTDSDLPFDLASVGTAVELVRRGRADVVSTYRHDRGGEGVRRYWYSVVYNLLVRWVFGLKVRDVNFAGKLIRREVLDHVELQSTGSFIDAELLARADRAGFRIAQFGVDYHPRSQGISTLSSMRVIRGILTDMWRLAPSIRQQVPGAPR